MRGRKYVWENDYLDGAVTDYLQERDVVLKPKKKMIDDVMFSEALIAPIVTLIKDAIYQEQKIGIVGDYDVDGITATTILVQVLRALGADVTYYIPQRLVDGYGINAQIVEQFDAEGVKLIITVDNGIVAFEAAAVSKAKNIKMIITDHHALAATLPDTPYILHPALDSELQHHEMCGASVAFLLARKLSLHHPAFVEYDAQWLQLAMLGTMADMMPLNQPFNRALSVFGFAALLDEPILGVQAFTKLQQIEQLSSDEVSFKLIPTLNAVGRLADANDVVAAFLATDEAFVLQAFETFIACNDERKKMTERIYQEIIATLQPEVYEEKGFLIIHQAGWHQGILGILAQRLMQELGRPILLLSNVAHDPDMYTGSARAFGRYSVQQMLSEMGAYFLKAGGHEYAGGVTIERAKLVALQTSIDQYNEQLAENLDVEAQMIPLQIDTWLPFHELNEKFLQRQEQFAPYGEKNKKFTIGVKHVQISNIQPLGKTKQHVKVTVMEGKKKYQIVAFQMFALLEEAAKYSFVDVVVEVQRNVYNGIARLQYVLLDIRLPKKQLFDLRQQRLQRMSAPFAADSFVVQAIPLDTESFLKSLTQEQIRRIYLLAIPFEDHLLYATEIEQQYFNFVYKYIHQKRHVNLADDALYRDLAQRKVPKSIFLYILQVFFELNFVIIENNICQMKSHAQKSALINSPSYNQMTHWLALRNILLTGSIEQLYQKFIVQ